MASPQNSGVFRLDGEIYKHLRVEVAQNERDFLSALILLKTGCSGRDETPRRVSRYHLLPSTTTVVIKFKEEVLGALFVTIDGPLGLPSGADSELKEFRQQGRLIGEISELLIQKKCRKEFGTLEFLVLKFVLNYATRFLQLDILLRNSEAWAAGFYEETLGFQRLKQVSKMPQRPWGQGQGSLLQYLPLKQWFKETQSVKNDGPQEGFLDCSYEGVLTFIHNEDFSEQLIYPQREYYSACDPVVSPSFFARLLRSKWRIEDEIAPLDVEFLKSQYGLKSYEGVKWPYRAERRFLSGVPGHVRGYDSNVSGDVRVVDVSGQGAGMITSLSFAVGSRVILQLEGVTRQPSLVLATIRVAQEGRYGLQVNQCLLGDWQQYVTALQGHFQFKPAA